MNFLKWFCKRADVIIRPPNPQPGEVWELDGNDELPPSKKVYVRIHEVKDGWVIYGMGLKRGTVFENEERKLGNFVGLYSRYKPAIWSYEI